MGQGPFRARTTSSRSFPPPPPPDLSPTTLFLRAYTDVDGQWLRHLLIWFCAWRCFIHQSEKFSMDFTSPGLLSSSPKASIFSSKPPSPGSLLSQPRLCISAYSIPLALRSRTLLTILWEPTFSVHGSPIRWSGCSPPCILIGSSPSLGWGAVFLH